MVSIIAFLELSKKVTSSEVAELLGISTVWASKILRKMVEEGLVIKVGKNRYTYYILKSDEMTR
jgi:Mn-dependent DtxR family transcriptional regulator